MSLSRAALAFIKRDFFLNSSYRLRFVGQLCGALLSLATLYLLGRLVTPGVGSALDPYGGSYFSFVLIGIALSDFMLVSVGTFEREIRKAQTFGTFEALLLSPLSLSELLFCTFLYPMLTTSLRLVLYLVLGWLLLAYPITPGVVFGLFVALPLATLPFVGLGLISAAFIVVFKQGSPLSWLVGASSALVSGVLYPVSILPDWLRWLGDWLPLTHGLAVLRGVLLQDATLGDVISELLILLLFSFVLLALGLVAVRYALRVARRDGTLLHY